MKNVKKTEQFLREQHMYDKEKARGALPSQVALPSFGLLTRSQNSDGSSITGTQYVY